MTRVLCAGPAIWPETRASLSRFAPQAEIVAFDQHDWRAYWRAVFRGWGEDALLIVEQDNILHEFVLPQLEACPQEWCVFPYRHEASGGDGFARTCLGTTRFSRAFQQKVTAEEVASEGGNCNRCYGQPDKHMCWLHVEGRISDAATRLGFARHLHWPSVGHRDAAPGEFPEEM